MVWQCVASYPCALRRQHQGTHRRRERGKVRYRTQLEAEYAAFCWPWGPLTEQMCAYRCPICQSWHIGHAERKPA